MLKTQTFKGGRPARNLDTQIATEHLRKGKPTGKKHQKSKVRARRRKKRGYQKKRGGPIGRGSKSPSRHRAWAMSNAYYIETLNGDIEGGKEKKILRAGKEKKW